MSKLNLFYNVFTLTGEQDKIKRIVDHFIINHPSDVNGYQFNIMDMTTAWGGIQDYLKYRRNRKEIDSLIAASLDTSIEDELLLDYRRQVYRWFFNVASKLQLKPLNKLTVFLNYVETHPNGLTQWCTQQVFDEIYQELSNYTAVATETWFHEIEGDLPDSLSDAELNNLIASENDYYRAFCSFIPLSLEEFGDTTLGLDDLQSYNVIEDENDKNIVTLIVGTLSKHGPVLELVEDICNLYNVEGELVFGNEITTGHYKVIEKEGVRVTTLSRNEPSLEHVAYLLQQIAQLENAIEYFKWTYEDVYPELDDEEFIANAPVGGID